MQPARLDASTRPSRTRAKWLSVETAPGRGNCSFSATSRRAASTSFDMKTATASRRCSSSCAIHRVDLRKPSGERLSFSRMPLGDELGDVLVDDVADMLEIDGEGLHLRSAGAPPPRSAPRARSPRCSAAAPRAGGRRRRPCRLVSATRWRSSPCNALLRAASIFSTTSTMRSVSRAALASATAGVRERRWDRDRAAWPGRRPRRLAGSSADSSLAIARQQADEERRDGEVEAGVEIGGEPRRRSARARRASAAIRSRNGSDQRAPTRRVARLPSGSRSFTGSPPAPSSTGLMALPILAPSTMASVASGPMQAGGGERDHGEHDRRRSNAPPRSAPRRSRR